MTDPWMVQSTGTHSDITVNGVAAVSDQQQQLQGVEAPLEFEDNFITSATTSAAAAATANASNQIAARRTEPNSNEHQPLPDSDNYLRGLERKLQKIKKGSNLVEALAEKRNDCLRTLLKSGTDSDSAQNNNDAALALDEPINNGELYRHLQPVQPISVGELVHIVKYDQLEQEQQQESQQGQEPVGKGGETSATEKADDKQK